MSNLNERAMLVTLHISAYSGMMFDREVSEEVNESFKADRKDAGRYNKRLVAAKYLTDVSSAHSNARRVHRILTLPWEDNGTRILSAHGFIEYQKRMKECKYKVESEVKQFIEGLPEYVAEARTRLGDMFNEDDYPSLDELKMKFNMETEVKSIPEAADFRAKLSDDAVKGIVKDIERRCNQRLENAMNDIFERVAERVGKLVEKLREYQPAKDGAKATIMRDSVVYNINEFAQLMPVLNITDDPRINSLQKQLLDELVEHSPEILRADAKVRQQTLTKAEKILKKVEQYMK